MPTAAEMFPPNWLSLAFFREKFPKSNSPETGQRMVIKTVAKEEMYNSKKNEKEMKWAVKFFGARAGVVLCKGRAQSLGSKWGASENWINKTVSIYYAKVNGKWMICFAPMEGDKALPQPAPEPAREPGDESEGDLTPPAGPVSEAFPEETP